MRCVDRLFQTWDSSDNNTNVVELLAILKQTAGVLKGATRRVESVFQRFRNFSQWEGDDYREVDLMELLERRNSSAVNHFIARCNSLTDVDRSSLPVDHVHYIDYTAAFHDRRMRKRSP